MYKVRGIDALSKLYKNQFSHEFVEDVVEEHITGFQLVIFVKIICTFTSNFYPIIKTEYFLNYLLST